MQRKLLLAILLYIGALVWVEASFGEVVDTNNKFVGELKSEEFDFKKAKTLEMVLQEHEEKVQAKEQKRLEDEKRKKAEKIVKEQARLKKIEESKRRVIDVEVSFYCSCSRCCNAYATLNPGITASGTRVKFGTIAAPKELKFGTQMKLKSFGDKIFTVEDRGGYIKKSNGVYRLDVYVDSHSKALELGRYRDKATIID